MRLPVRLFDERQAEGGRLFYQGDVPVVVLQGSPEQIGRQHAALLGPHAEPVLEFPKRFIAEAGGAHFWPLLVQAGRTLMLQAPPRYQRELVAAADQGAITAAMVEVLPVANTLLELRRLGCSAVALADERTTTDGPLLGRNFDFETMGILDRYTVLFVVRPEGRHAFASVGFPGLGGVLSGMNDAGLALATLDVYQSADKSRKFDPTGTPLAFVFRRILEECSTVDEAEALLRSEQITTWMNLIVCDPRESAVFELTPATVGRREPAAGVLSCTNHFRCPELSVGETCWRYSRLAAAAQSNAWNVDRVQSLLHSVNQGEFTMQTMVFEPRSRRLHLATGKPPVSDRAMTTFDLGPLLAERAANGTASAAVGQ
ncbi:MAG: hypothetical protein KDA44_21390 [Planctomycetales bacterium]|nr:hypothetical protein [Planctomycetales bacterium]